MARQQWRLEDPKDPNPETRVYVFPINPNKMASPFLDKNVTAEGTSAVDGQVLLWQGVTPAKEWTFGGAVYSKAEYEALRDWVFERSGRLFVYDHFGRRLTVVLTGFEPEVVRRYGRYWRHDYTVKAMLLAQPTAPLVDAEGWL